MMLEYIAHLGWYATKETQIAVFDQSHERIMAEASWNLKAEILRERRETQISVFHDGESSLYICRRHTTSKATSCG